MVNILYIETSQSRVIGGSFYSLLEIVKGLNKNSYKPFVLFYDRNSLVPNFVSSGASVFHFVSDNKKSERASFKKSSNLKLLLWKSLGILGLEQFTRTVIFMHRHSGFVRVAEGIVKKHNIGLLHINDGLTPGLPFIRMAKRLDLPIIVHERKIRKYGLVERFFLKDVARVICISDTVKENFNRQFSGSCKAATIYNPVASDLSMDVVKKEALMRRLNIEKDVPIILQISNLIQWKGQDTLIDAIKVVAAKIPSVKLFLVGGIPLHEEKYAEEIEMRVKGYSLERNVVFCGFQEERSIFFDMADIVVHVPKLPEPFGRVVLEAMQLGKPVITSNNGGTAEIVEDGVNGLLVSPGRPGELADAILKIIMSPELRQKIGKTGKRTAEEKFSNAIFNDKIHNLYSEILLSRRP